MVDALMDTFGLTRVEKLLKTPLLKNNKLVSQYALSIHHLMYASTDTLSLAKRYVENLFENLNENQDEVEGKIQQAVIDLHRILMNSNSLKDVMDLHRSLIEEFPHVESKSTYKI
jgi:phosphomevalonate kinase